VADLLEIGGEKVRMLNRKFRLLNNSS
jgi:hypothetical protein